jgi:preprotein translocase subunit SecG
MKKKLIWIALILAALLLILIILLKKHTPDGGDNIFPLGADIKSVPAGPSPHPKKYGN